MDLRLAGWRSLQDDNGPLSGQITQRRRLALLAVLAVSRTPISRDRLVGILWPELDSEGARHRLSDSLYVVRRALGDAAVTTVGDDVWLDDTHLSVDVRAFDRVLDTGALEPAIALYTGPFLDGFHLSGAAEFERWTDDERARLAGRYAAALRSLATDSENASNFARAADQLRLLAAIDPLDVRVTLRLMAALERSGDAAAAVRQARVHQALRASELGLPEDGEIQSAAVAISARASVPRPSVQPIEPSPPVTTDSTESAPISSPRRRKRSMIAGALAAAIVGVMAWWAASGRTTQPSPTVAQAERVAVAVFPFSDRGDGAPSVSGEAMAALLATKLDGGAGWRSIDPNALFAQYGRDTQHPDPADAARLARRMGAQYFVLGDIVRAAAGVHIGAALYDAERGEPMASRIGVEGSDAALFELVDSLAMRLLVGRRDEPAPQLAHLASLTTGSLPALKEYLAGEAELRAGRYAHAAEHFDRATTADTTFALAYYRLGNANGWSRSGDVSRAFRSAAHYSTRLPNRVRVTLAALVARRGGDDETAERLLRQVVAAHPDDFDANYELGDLLFHANPPRGRDPSEAKESLERAAQLDPTRSAEALFHLVAIASIQNQPAALDSLAVLFLTRHPDNEPSFGVRALLSLERRDERMIRESGRQLAKLPLSSALIAASQATSLSHNHSGDRQLVLELDLRDRAPTDHAAVLIALAKLAGARGDWREADSLFTRARALDAARAIEARARLLSLPIDTPQLSAIRSARDDLLHASTSPNSRTTLLAALLALRAGDINGTASKAGQADETNRALETELTARTLLSRGRPADALVALERDSMSPVPALRFLRGEVLEALGRTDEALRWYVASEHDYDGELFARAIARASSRLAKSVH